MDLIRTLGVAIDPSGAKRGGEQAADAFRKVGETAQRTEKQTASTRKEMDATGAAMGRTKRAGDILRETLDRQNVILTKMNTSIQALTVILRTKKSAMDAASSSTERMSRASRRAATATRDVAQASQGATTAANTQAAALGRLALMAGTANAQLVRLYETTMRMRSTGPLALAGGGGGGRGIINVTGTVVPDAPPFLQRGAAGAGAAGGSAAAAGAGVGASMLGHMRGALAPLGVIGGAAGGVMAGMHMGRTALEVQRVGNALRYASGGAEEFAKNTEFLRDASEALGLDLMSSTREFAKFAAAAKGGAITTDEVREIFLSVAKAATVLGLSSEATAGTFNALQQMISKGNVQAEELRQQLGERLPGAFTFAANALGVTTKELNKMLDLGQVTAKDLLPKLAKELDKAFGPDAARSATLLNSEFNRLKTAFLDFKTALNDFAGTAFFTSLLTMARDLLTVLTGIVNKVRELSSAMPDWTKYLKPMMSMAFPGASILRGMASSFGSPADAARQAEILTPSKGPPSPPRMSRFVVRPSALETFRGGLAAEGIEVLLVAPAYHGQEDTPATWRMPSRPAV